MQRYSILHGLDNGQYCCEDKTPDGKYVLHSEAQARIESLEAALRATIAYMKDDSGGYEVYRAILDSARKALSESAT